MMSLKCKVKSEQKLLSASSTLENLDNLVTRQNGNWPTRNPQPES